MGIQEHNFLERGCIRKNVGGSWLEFAKTCGYIFTNAGEEEKGLKACEYARNGNFHFALYHIVLIRDNREN